MEIITLLQIIGALLIIALLVDASFRATFVRIVHGLVSDAARRRNAARYRGPDGADAASADGDAGEDDEEPDVAAPHISDETIDALARLVAANRISAATACSVALGIDQRGNNATYRRIVRRAEELRAQDKRDEVVAFRADGRAIRRDPDGRRYVINGRTKEYIDE